MAGWFGRKKLVAASTAAPPADRPTELAEVVAETTAQPAATQAAAPSPDESLGLLKAGNEAFINGENNLGHVRAGDLDALQSGQQPIAVIVGCADSRTPPTILFNQGFGRLFSIRVAGNTVDNRGLASIVYAVKHLKCPLVVVMGHTGCGAVAAAQAVADGEAPLDPSLEAMLTPIIPPVLAARRKGEDPVAENARWVATKLRTADSALAVALERGDLKIVAAVKQMESGRVAFLD